MKRENLLLTLVLFLVALNIVVVARTFMRQGPPGPPPHDRIIIKTLGFDEEQQQAFEALKFKHRSGVIQIEKQFESVLEQYFLLLPNEDQSKKDSLDAIICDLERRKAAVTFEHFRELRQLCRPDQQKTFDNFIPELSKFIMPQGPKNLPPPRRN
ncbi:MAG TPA: hypothetical protein VFE50_25860 [Cyclobacteriaceae bacterium]|nr:hypothetical protein [Cyclobacteriaceae bacterium]